MKTVGWPATKNRKLKANEKLFPHGIKVHANYVNAFNVIIETIRPTVIQHYSLDITGMFAKQSTIFSDLIRSNIRIRTYWQLSNCKTHNVFIKGHYYIYTLQLYYDF